MTASPLPRRVLVALVLARSVGPAAFDGGPATPPGTSPALELRRVELSAPAVAIPFASVDRRVSVAALVDGEGPFHFIVDTGASGAGRVDVAVAERLGLPRVGRVLQDDTTGRRVAERDSVLAGELRLAGATFHDVALTASDHGWIAAEGELPVHGILGLGLFEDLLLEIDYPARAIELSRRRLDPERPGVVRYDDAMGLCAVPVRIGDVALSALLDTGSAAGLLVPERWRERLATTREPRLTARGRLANSAFRVESAPLRDALHLSGHALAGLEVGFADVDLAPNLGYDVLRGFVLTIDQRSGCVRLARGE